MATFEEIGVKLSCGKVTGHSYCPVFEEYLSPMRDAEFNLLELGIDVGASLRLWLEYFTKAKIYGVDSGNPVLLPADVADRCYQYSCNVAEPQVGRLFPSNHFDVIVDDASHAPDQQLAAREHLWHTLKPGGLYFVEDMPLAHHTSQILLPWSKMYGFKVWTNFKDNSGNFRDDDCLVLVRKPE